MISNRFGTQLKLLRHQAGLTQDSLVKKLQALVDPQAQRAINRSTISKWETQTPDRNGYTTKPTRVYMEHLLRIFADQLTPTQAQQWAELAGHTLSPNRPSPTYCFPVEPPTPNRLMAFNRLETLPHQRLFGVTSVQADLVVRLDQTDDYWLLAISGLGGLGKTTLAHAVMQEKVGAHVAHPQTGRFYDFAWVSAKQEEYLPHLGLQPTHRPALTEAVLVDELLSQFASNFSLARPPDEKLAILTNWFRCHPYLVVIDNLETVLDYEAILPTLRQWSKPTKFLLTSRHSLSHQTDVYSLNLNELSQADAFAMLRYAGETQHLPALVEADEAQLDLIYQVVGGNPLALKLVIGQLRVAPLGQLLDSFRQSAQGKIVDFYRYVYFQSWQLLTEPARQILTIMPLVQGGTFEDVCRHSRFAPQVVTAALQQLSTLSLVDVHGSLTERRYHIHRLTETFLLQNILV